MKKLFMYVFVIVFGSLLNSNSLQAQFLKKIMNTVNQTTQSRANQKTEEATNKAIDRTLDGPSSSFDTASTNKVLGAFAQAARQNPNDTSTADLTMKGLEILVGGGGVSAADSAAAIKRFTSAKGGSGYYYEMLTISTTKKGASKDTAKMFFTSAGEGRSEMRINIPGTMTNQFINLGNAASAKYSVMLYPETKTYTLNIIDTSLINSGIERYEVTKLGTETIQGFVCTHARVKSTTGRGIIKSSSIMDIWASPDVPGYSFIKKVMINQNLKPQLQEALEKNNCGGYIVKMSAKEKDYSMEMTLIKAETTSFPASLFKIPGGYKKSNENMMYHMMAGIKN